MTTPVTLTVTTEQEAFDHTVRYLATKRGRAGRYIDDHDDGQTFACSYDSPNGPCAIGSMIEDDSDRCYLDSLGAAFGLNELIESGHVLTRINAGLLVSLQATHDYTDNWDSEDVDGTFCAWEDMATLARQFQLDTTVLDEMRTD